jgi:hypothetical protein
MDRLWKEVPFRDTRQDYNTLAEMTFPFGDLGSYQAKPLPPLKILQIDGEKTLFIEFTASNGYSSQLSCFRKVGDTGSTHLSQAYQVTHRRKVVKLDIDKDYPRKENGKIDCF